ncbi:Lrp/AsnC family transcriptional regulator [Pseudochelatococcus contaminans]|uniref:DNA-binding Lrp family transcriptional regulator n=1 Tax=Pseudochelatococcus contaminans TaxID=1538103 RepID=A0A7W5Z4Q4_9HYPH|nr:Lrp/AsnC family transcriptional regulator [Pseudochelatococcus contaminans]MBB3809687.1 DNA-binding Lrp family transcriptional regulator [Pseudochelatococcus contaminans]
MTTTLDAVDRAILLLLRQNARRTNAAIAAEVGLSPSACHRRIKLLETIGVIRGYTVLTSGVSQGEDAVSVVVQVTLERQTEDFLARFESAVRKRPEIKECFLMTGAVDYWLRVEVENTAAYEALHGEVLSRLPGVTRIHSSLAMRDALNPRRSKVKHR